MEDRKKWEMTSEKELQSAVLEYMGWRSWLVYHTHDSRRSQPGFPDVVGVKGSRLVFIELKTEKGKLRAEQKEWLDRLVKAHDEVYLVRPSTQDALFENLENLGSNLRCHWKNLREGGAWSDPSE